MGKSETTIAHFVLAKTCTFFFWSPNRYSIGDLMWPMITCYWKEPCDASLRGETHPCWRTSEGVDKCLARVPGISNSEEVDEATRKGMKWSAISALLAGYKIHIQ